MEKKKGFIRWEAVVPFAVISVLVGVYFTLFFDAHLKRGIELAGYQILGAEVNVDKLRSSFFRASLFVGGIQLTNGEKPTHNLVSIGEVNFSMSWDALLRGKILIELASIEQIQFDSKRKTAGRVKPPDPVSNEPSMLEREGQKLVSEALDTAKEQYGDNILGDIANLMSGGNAQDQVKNLESQMQSKKHLEELQKQFSDKQKMWNEKVKSLPQQKDLNAWSDRFKKIKTKDFATPQELQDSLQQFQTLVREIDTTVKDVEKSGQELSNDLKYFEGQVKELEKLVQTDIKSLEAHFKIPKLDASAMTKALFKRYAGPYVAQFYKYQKMAQKHIPPGLLKKKDNQKEEEDISIQPRAREHGISYEFGRPNSYPFFWMKKARISSKATPGIPSLGNLSGEALNVTSNQVLIGRPTQINFQGDFPELQIAGIDARLTLNHTKRPFKESFSAQVASYPVDKKMLIDSKDVELGFMRAIGSVAMKVNYSDRYLEFSVANAYKQLEYIVSASNKEVDGILKSVMKRIPLWTIDASGSGEFPNLPIELKSNLGGEIARGFERVLREKVEEAKAKIKKMVDEVIAREKAKFEEEVHKNKARIEAEVNKIKESLEKQKAEIDDKIEEAKKEEGKKVQKQLETEIKKHLNSDDQKKLEDLKKKIKF